MPNTPDGWKIIAQKFEEETHFPRCVGALDGKHITIENPLYAGSTYFNYKGTFSIVLMAICDSNYCFTYANIGAQGRISDGGVFNDSSFALKMDRGTLNLPTDEPLATGRKCVPYVIVADNAFALKKNIMIPHPGKASGTFNSRERIFNYRLSSARSRIENTFGIMASVFRIFRRPMLLEPEKARVVTECSVLLHNFLRRSRTSQATYTPSGTFDKVTEVDGRLQQIPGSWRKDTAGLTSFLPLSSVARKACQTAKEVREEFGNFFLTDLGEVPWQYYLQ